MFIKSITTIIIAKNAIAIIASNYYISGAQGEKKGIPLDRSLVEWKCKL